MKNEKQKRERVHNKLVGSIKATLISERIAEKNAFKIAEKAVASAWCIGYGGSPTDKTLASELGLTEH